MFRPPAVPFIYHVRRHYTVRHLSSSVQKKRPPSIQKTEKVYSIKAASTLATTAEKPIAKAAELVEAAPVYERTVPP